MRSESGLPGLPPSLRDLMSSVGSLDGGRPSSADGAAAELETGPVVGMFVSSGDPTAAEICAGAGFDYLLIDGEHSPLSLETILAQLRAVSGYPVLPVVRVPDNDEVVIKQYLDLGVQTLVVPMVDSVSEAQAAARAVAYPPEGVRGVGGRGGWRECASGGSCCRGRACVQGHGQARAAGRRRGGR